MERLKLADRVPDNIIHSEEAFSEVAQALLFGSESEADIWRMYGKFVGLREQLERDHESYGNFIFKVHVSIDLKKHEEKRV